MLPPKAILYSAWSDRMSLIISDKFFTNGNANSRSMTFFVLHAHILPPLVHTQTYFTTVVAHVRRRENGTPDWWADTSSPWPLRVIRRVVYVWRDLPWCEDRYMAILATRSAFARVYRCDWRAIMTDDCLFAVFTSSRDGNRLCVSCRTCF